jgi:hypothetical protein
MPKNEDEEIPREFKMAIIRLQAAENLDLRDAYLRAAVLIDKNNQEFKHSVELRAQVIYKARFMTEVNKSRNTFYTKGYNDSTNWVRINENNFKTPCSNCGQLMPFSSRDSNWAEVQKVLFDAFKGWRHTSHGS